MAGWGGKDRGKEGGRERRKQGRKEGGRKGGDMDWTTCGLQEVKLLPGTENRGVQLN